MPHDTSIDLIRKLSEIRKWCYGIAGAGPEHLKHQAREFVNWIAETIGEEI